MIARETGLSFLIIMTWKELKIYLDSIFNNDQDMAFFSINGSYTIYKKRNIEATLEDSASRLPLDKKGISKTK
jgi:hypothetical protein